MAWAVSFRSRRLWRVNIEALLIASVQNIKQLLKPRRSRQKPLPPAPSLALMPPLLAVFFSFFLFDLQKIRLCKVS